MVSPDLPSSQCPTPVPHLSHHAVMAWRLPDVFPFHPCPLFWAFFCCKPFPWEMSCHWMLCIRDVWCVKPGAYHIVQAYKPGSVPSPSRRAPEALCCILTAILARPTYYFPVSRADCKWSRQDVSSKSACISHMEDRVSINTPPETPCLCIACLIAVRTRGAGCQLPFIAAPAQPLVAHLAPPVRQASKSCGARLQRAQPCSPM